MPVYIEYQAVPKAYKRIVPTVIAKGKDHLRRPKTPMIEEADKASIKKPTMYPPVGPVSLPMPPSKPENTGIPSEPRKIYRKSAPEAIGGGDTAATIYMAKDASVSGIGPTCMLNGDSTQTNAHRNAVMVSALTRSEITFFVSSLPRVLIGHASLFLSPLKTPVIITAGVFCSMRTRYRMRL